MIMTMTITSTPNIKVDVRNLNHIMISMSVFIKSSKSRKKQTAFLIRNLGNPFSTSSIFFCFMSETNWNFLKDVMKKLVWIYWPQYLKRLIRSSFRTQQQSTWIQQELMMTSSRIKNENERARNGSIISHSFHDHVDCQWSEQLKSDDHFLGE